MKLFYFLVDEFVFKMYSYIFFVIIYNIIYYNYKGEWYGYLDSE